MTLRRTPLIIHGFAFLHALVSILCLAGGVSDTVLLTLLTITMTVLLGLRYSLTMEITALTVVLVNIAGFFLGTLGAWLLELFLAESLWTRAAATFLTTEILGWTMVLFSGKPSAGPIQVEPRKMTWLLVAVTLVFAVRIVIDLYFWQDGSSQESFFRTFLFAVLAEATICSVLYMVKLAIEYREEARRSEFRYMVLKHQVNPHFLFNSLNILNSLVLDGRKEEADVFIRKLAGIYRYMTAHEGDRLEVRDEDRNRQVIPCSVQLLVENAIKHNIISAEDPLEITIRSNGTELVVSNDIKPKLTHGPSTGLGQKYIRQQYKDLSEKQITIEQTGGVYTVHMPLI